MHSKSGIHPFFSLDKLAPNGGIGLKLEDFHAGCN